MLFKNFLYILLGILTFLSFTTFSSGEVQKTSDLNISNFEFTEQEGFRLNFVFEVKNEFSRAEPGIKYNLMFFDSKDRLIKKEFFGDQKAFDLLAGGGLKKDITFVTDMNPAAFETTALYLLNSRNEPLAIETVSVDFTPIVKTTNDVALSAKPLYCGTEYEKGTANVLCTGEGVDFSGQTANIDIYKNSSYGERVKFLETSPVSVQKNSARYEIRGLAEGFYEAKIYLDDGTQGVFSLDFSGRYENSKLELESKASVVSVMENEIPLLEANNQTFLGAVIWNLKKMANNDLGIILIAAFFAFIIFLFILMKKSKFIIILALAILLLLLVFKVEEVQGATKVLGHGVVIPDFEGNNPYTENSALKFNFLIKELATGFKAKDLGVSVSLDGNEFFSIPKNTTQSTFVNILTPTLLKGSHVLSFLFDRSAIFNQSEFDKARYGSVSETMAYSVVAGSNVVPPPVCVLDPARVAAAKAGTCVGDIQPVNDSCGVAHNINGERACSCIPASTVFPNEICLGVVEENIPMTCPGVFETVVGNNVDLCGGRLECSVSPTDGWRDCSIGSFKLTSRNDSIYIRSLHQSGTISSWDVRDAEGGSSPTYTVMSGIPGNRDIKMELNPTGNGKYNNRKFYDFDLMAEGVMPSHIKLRVKYITPVFVEN